MREIGDVTLFIGRIQLTSFDLGSPAGERRCAAHPRLWQPTPAVEERGRGILNRLAKPAPMDKPSCASPHLRLSNASPFSSDQSCLFYVSFRL